MTTSILTTLRASRAGDGAAARELVPLVYDELHALAARSLRRERRGHTWQTTELAHEAYLRLVDQREAGLADRHHFLAIAAEVVRRVLVDHARRRDALARGGAFAKHALDGVELVGEGASIDLLALDGALSKLGALDERQARVVELRFFSGLSIEETADVLGVSAGTVKGDWYLARAFLRRELEG